MAVNFVGCRRFQDDRAGQPPPRSLPNVLDVSIYVCMLLGFAKKKKREVEPSGGSFNLQNNSELIWERDAFSFFVLFITTT